MATQQQPAIDEARVEQFVEQVVGHYSGSMTMVLSALGDKLGLFKDLAEQGPATASELADRTGIAERYALEWLRGMKSSGYVEYDRGSERFTLPPEHALVLATEGSPAFFGGGIQMMFGLTGVMERLTTAFRNGGGVEQSAYSDDVWEGMQRFTDGWFENFLLQQWIPSMPDVQRKLDEGALYADVGCGAARALIKLAEAFPSSRFVGFDVSEQQVRRARANMEAAGLADRVRIELKDVSEGLPERFDVISTYDVIHDAVDPLGLLKTIRQALKDDGIYICLDINCADDPADNEGPLAAMFYGFSITYCMTTSLARNGAGLGTCGLPEAKLRELSQEAGFGEVRRVEMDDPFNSLYELRP